MKPREDRLSFIVERSRRSMKPRETIGKHHITIAVKLEVAKGADKQLVGRQIVGDIQEKFRYTNREIDAISVEVVSE